MTDFLVGYFGPLCSVIARSTHTQSCGLLTYSDRITSATHRETFHVDTGRCCATPGLSGYTEQVDILSDRSVSFRVHRAGSEDSATNQNMVDNAAYAMDSSAAKPRVLSRDRATDPPTNPSALQVAAILSPPGY